MKPRLGWFLIRPSFISCFSDHVIIQLNSIKYLTNGDPTNWYMTNINRGEKFGHTFEQIFTHFPLPVSQVLY